MIEIAIQTSVGLTKQASKKSLKRLPQSTRNNADKNMRSFKQIGVGTSKSLVNSENGGSAVKTSRNNSSSKAGTIKSQRSLKKKLSSATKSSKSKRSMRSVEEHKYPTVNTADHMPLSGSKVPLPAENTHRDDFIKI